MAVGTVKWFNATKGYGFIQPVSGGKDVFVHLSALGNLGLKDLKEGQKLSYDITTERGKEAATNLRLQSLIALALVVFGLLQHDGFEAMVEFTAPVFWSFLFLVGLSVFKLRRHRQRHDGYRLPLYPFTPLLFCASCAYLSYSSITYAASKNAVHISFAVMGVGLVALVLLQLRERSSK